MKKCEKTDMILFLGQSNMQGETEMLVDDTPVTGAAEYKYLSDSLTELKNPAGEDIGHGMKPGYALMDSARQGEWITDNVLASAAYGRTSLVPAFASGYIKASGRKTVAVCAAKGSAGLNYWLPGTEGFGAVVAKAKAAVEKLGEGLGHVYAVWLQGESDAMYGTGCKRYREGLLAFKNGIREHIPLDYFGIIRVGVFASAVSWRSMSYEEALANDRAIQQAQEDLCREEKDFILLTRITDKLLADEKYVNPLVQGHFGARGLHVLGLTAGYNLGRFASGREYSADEIQEDTVI